MTADVLTVDLDVPYAEIAALLAEHRINAVPVLDDLRRLAGIVTEGDLLRRVEFLGEPADATHLLERPSRRAAREKARAAVARQLMTVPAVTVSPDAAVADAARLMADRNIKQLPVVDRQGRLVGIVARRNLLAVFKRADADIRAEIVESILRRALHLEPDAVTVDVRDGVVTLSGMVRQASKAQIAVRLAEAVTGVTAVLDHIRFELDDERAGRPAGEPGEGSGPLLVVGVDGSDGGREALSWAVAHAADVGGSVLAVAAWHWLEDDLSTTLEVDERQHLSDMLAREVEALPARQRAAVPLRTKTVRGRPAEVLCAESAGAALLVLGRHGHSRARAARAGSVSEECIRRAPCPVVVVPRPHHEPAAAAKAPAGPG
ncbi:CBS domain-containing protein [Catellatospora sp. IY07-71]|uniref:CBS domain-containing protein n=1 Tax=Catellatospora sp. IY07-71 TaxID=2728827 RepID=UPI001BB38447|nr:CBS domain-containing protein [Catellatospora sp. IY07-71]